MNKTTNVLLPSHPHRPGDTPAVPAARIRRTTLRRGTGYAGGVLAALFIAWLPLGILGLVPFLLQIPGESLLRTHAGAAVACLMVTAWACWED